MQCFLSFFKMFSIHSFTERGTAQWSTAQYVAINKIMNTNRIHNLEGDFSFKFLVPNGTVCDTCSETQISCMYLTSIDTTITNQSLRFLHTARHVEPPSDDDSVNDNQSQLSLDQHHNDGSSGADHHSADERDDEKLLIALEDATEKSVQKRTAALQAVVDELSHRYLADCVEDRKCTMMDLIERTLRRGKGAEQTLGAQLVPLLVLQLGDADIVGRALAPLLLQTAQNAAVSYGARAKCCEALALLAVLSGSDAGDAMQTMQSMESIFAPAYVKSAPGQTSGAAAGAANDASLLHCAALNAWALLLTLCPAGDLCSMVNRGGVPGFP